jgi:hypothetical protein
MSSQLVEGEEKENFLNKLEKDDTANVTNIQDEKIKIGF